MYYYYSLLVLFALSAFAVAEEETTCQTHRRNSQAGGAPVQWNITCNEQTGKYEEMQCTVQEPKWCACYDEEGPVTQPSRSTKTCKCPLARHRAQQNSASDCDVPQCERSGHFQKRQCCETTGKCHCVDPNTGERKSEPVSDRNVQCS